MKPGWIPLAMIPFVLCACRTPADSRLSGAWFFEFGGVKVVSVFEPNEDGRSGRHIGFSSEGTCQTWPYRLLDDHTLQMGSVDRHALAFRGEDILFLKPKGGDMYLVYKKIEDGLLLEKTRKLIDRFRSDLEQDELSAERREALAAAVRSELPWGAMTMSLTEYTVLVKQQQYTEIGKTSESAAPVLDFSRDYEVDTTGLASLAGRWEFNGRDIFDFTNEAVSEFTGATFYRFTVTSKEGKELEYDCSYTVLRKKTDNKSYLFQLLWRTELNPPEELVFEGNDRLVLYRDGEPHGRAVRVAK